MRRRVLILLYALAGLAALPTAAQAVSSLTVAVHPPIAGATPTVTFTMASDDPTVRFAIGYMRVDDGRPCEATLPAFEVASPGYVFLGSVPFSAGVATLTAPRLQLPGSHSLCGYLTGSTNLITLALDDHLVPVRLPTASATVTLDPAVPVFSRPVNLRVAGSVDIPAVMNIVLTSGGCAEDAVLGSEMHFVGPGTYDVTSPGLLLNQKVRHLCLAIRPRAELVSPHQAHLLKLLEQPVTQDLGGTVTGFQARRVGRALEVSARVTGTFRVEPKIRLDEPDGVRIVGNVCDTPSFREEPTDRLTIRGGLATGACLLEYDEARKLPRFDVSVVGVTTLGAIVETPVTSLDANEFRRTGRLVVPRQSIGFVRLGMPLQELIHQGGRPDGFQFRHPAPEKLILPGARSRSLYEVDSVLVLVQSGRVRGMLTNWGVDRDPLAKLHHTKTGLTPLTAAGRTGLRRKAPGARCRTHQQNRALTDLCLIGPATYWGARGRRGEPGFLAIWPGARVRPPSRPLLP